MMAESFEEILAENPANSLGRTLEVVDIILKDKSRLEELYETYFSDNEWGRLRTSNAFKRILRENPEWFEEYIDKFLDKIFSIDQPSTQWTMAQLFLEGDKFLSDDQRSKATTVFKKNLENTEDWIVLNATMQTLGEWAKKDESLAKWVLPHLQKLTKDPHKSVARRAEKLIATLEK